MSHSVATRTAAHRLGAKGECLYSLHMLHCTTVSTYFEVAYMTTSTLLALQEAGSEQRSSQHQRWRRQWTPNARPGRSAVSCFLSYST
jgi:hypothetical protein